jgi:hypothetical protein
MATLEQLTALKAKTEKLQREKDQAEGALKQSLRRLKEEFDCDSVEETQKLLCKLEGDEEAAQRNFDKAFAKFEKEWDVE